MFLESQQILDLNVCPGLKEFSIFEMDCNPQSNPKITGLPDCFNPQYNQSQDLWCESHPTWIPAQERENEDHEEEASERKPAETGRPIACAYSCLSSMFSA